MNWIKIGIAAAILAGIIAAVIAYVLTMEMSVIAGFMLGGWVGIMASALIFYNKLMA